MIDTDRLTLSRPSLADVADLFAISSDPRVWTHYPSLRPTDPARVHAAVERWLSGWAQNGLDTWAVRVSGQPRVIGYGGSSLHRGAWNLAYRFSADVHGRGYATELARAALDQARRCDAHRPVVARLLEHNTASKRVAEKVGLGLAYRAVDTDNPDPTAVRLIYTDRTLSAAQLAELVATS